MGSHGADRAGASSALPALGPNPRVSVVMPVRDAASALPATVAAVQAQGDEVDEIVLAVGPSQDGTWEVARVLAQDDRRVRVVGNPSGRTSDALNEAIAAATGQVLVRVDAQAHLPAGYVGEAVAALRRTGAANVGGRQVPNAPSGFGRAVAAAMRSRAGSGGAAYRGGGPAGPVDTVYLGVFRREAIEAVGGFDPAFVRNQDAECNERLRAAGYTVWLEPSLAVDYTPRSTVRGLARQYFEYGRYRRHTARVHRGSLRARQLAAPALVVVLVAVAAGSAALRTPWPMSVVLAGYLATLLAAGTAAADHGRDVVGVAFALATMHVCWGVGFLLGPPRERPVPSRSASTEP